MVDNQVEETLGVKEWVIKKQVPQKTKNWLLETTDIKPRTAHLRQATLGTQMITPSHKAGNNGKQTDPNLPEGWVPTAQASDGRVKSPKTINASIPCMEEDGMNMPTGSLSSLSSLSNIIEKEKQDHCKETPSKMMVLSKMDGKAKMEIQEKLGNEINRMERK